MTKQEANIEAIFLAAVEIDDPIARDSYLVDACGNDPSVRHRVDALIRSHQDAGSFLDRPPAAFSPTLAVDEINAVNDTGSESSLEFLRPTDKAGCIGTLGLYEVIEVVGRGGMGLVLKAHDAKLNRVVAIKVMAPELAANPAAAKRFLREAQATAAVVHDHVVTIHAIHEENRPPFIVMEYVDGRSLQDKIDVMGTIETKAILRIGMQAASGLAAAHQQGLVHRDIKPANILLENGVERVKITDFGLARAADDAGLTQTGLITGTPQYMSPEQALGQSVDARTDLFSLGSMLYAMCVGRPPFRADSAVAVLRRVADDQPRPIRQINPEIPDWLCAIIDKLLAKNRDDRFDSAEEVAELLAQYLAHLQRPGAQLPPSIAPPVRQQPVDLHANDHRPPAAMLPVEKDPPRRFRPRWIATSIGLILCTLFIVFGLLVYTRANRGTLIVETVNAGVKVAAVKDGRSYHIIDLKNEKNGTVRRSLVMPGGLYEIQPFGDQAVEIDRPSILLKRGDRVVVKVRGLAPVKAVDEPEAVVNAPKPPTTKVDSVAPNLKQQPQLSALWRYFADAGGQQWFRSSVERVDGPCEMKWAGVSMNSYSHGRVSIEDAEYGHTFRGTTDQAKQLVMYLDSALATIEKERGVVRVSKSELYQPPTEKSLGGLAHAYHTFDEFGYIKQGYIRVYFRDVKATTDDTEILEGHLYLAILERTGTPNDMAALRVPTHKTHPDVAVLVKQLEHSPTDRRIEIAEELRALGRTEAAVDAVIAVLTLAFHADSEQVAETALRAVAEIGGEQEDAARLAVPLMVAMTTDRKAPPRRRVLAARAIAIIAKQWPDVYQVRTSVPVLAKVLDENAKPLEDLVRTTLGTIREIGERRPELLIDQNSRLRRIFAETDSPSIRRAAAELLEMIPPADDE